MVAENSTVIEFASFKALEYETSMFEVPRRGVPFLNIIRDNFPPDVYKDSSKMVRSQTSFDVEMRKFSRDNLTSECNRISFKHLCNERDYRIQNSHSQFVLLNSCRKSVRNTAVSIRYYEETTPFVSPSSSKKTNSIYATFHQRNIFLSL